MKNGVGGGILNGRINLMCLLVMSFQVLDCEVEILLFVLNNKDEECVR